MNRESTTGDRSVDTGGHPFDVQREDGDSHGWQRDGAIAARLRAVAAGYDEIARELRAEAEAITFGRRPASFAQASRVLSMAARVVNVLRCEATQRSESFERRCTRDAGHAGSCLWSAWGDRQ